MLNIDDITCTSFNKLIKSSFLAAVQYPVQKQSAVTQISCQADGEMKVANKAIKSTAISTQTAQLQERVSRLFKSFLMMVELTSDFAHANYSFGA